MHFYGCIDLDSRDFLAYANCFQAIVRYFFYAKLMACLLSILAKEFKDFAVFEALSFA